MVGTPITKEEWMDWKSHKVTCEFLSRLYDNRETLKEGLVEGQAGDLDEINRVIGRCQGMKDAVEYAVRGFEVVDLSSKEDTE